MKRIRKITVAVAVLAFALVALASCQRRAVQAEVKELEDYLTVPKVDDVARDTKQAVSTTGRDIQVITLTFHTDQPVGDYRAYVNDFLLARGYAQASFLSAPGEFRIEYDGMNGNIHLIVTAEVSLPPESGMTTLPEQPAPEPPPAPPSNDGSSPPSAEGNAPDGEEVVLPPFDEATPYRKITLEISY